MKKREKREYKQIAQFQQIDKFKEWYNAEISMEKWARFNKFLKIKTELFSEKTDVSGNNLTRNILVVETNVQ